VRGRLGANQILIDSTMRRHGDCGEKTTLKTVNL
jgi:hypothetical protein